MKIISYRPFVTWKEIQLMRGYAFTRRIGNGLTPEHISGEKMMTDRVKPILDRIDNWNAYLSDAEKSNNEDLIELHTRAGSPLGSSDFVRKLEVITGAKLVPKKPGRKVVIRK